MKLLKVLSELMQSGDIHFNKIDPNQAISDVWNECENGMDEEAAREEMRLILMSEGWYVAKDAEELGDLAMEHTDLIEPSAEEAN